MVRWIYDRLFYGFFGLLALAVLMQIPLTASLIDAYVDMFWVQLIRR